jgi:cysteine desulfurase/selenocysteine lyase
MLVNRREFSAACGGAVLAEYLAALDANGETAKPETRWREYFPALRDLNEKGYIYFDTAATAQRPRHVLNAIMDYYSRDNGNPAEHLHASARRSYQSYESARSTVARFIHAADPLEVVFTRGTTEGINLVATAWGMGNLRPGDEILLTIAEHASCLLPWQLVGAQRGALVKYAQVSDDGTLDLTSLRENLTRKTKIVCFSHVSNVLGIINPAQEICELAHSVGARVLVDAAQSVPHFEVNVQQLGCDFMAFSGHKMMGPMGIGVLWARRSLLEAMPPYQAGSNMAHFQTIDKYDYSQGAWKFGAGTPNVSGAVGLAAAMRFIQEIGFARLWEHEQVLSQHMLQRLSGLKGLRLLGSGQKDRRISIFSFDLEGVRAEDISRLLDEQGIAIRAGDLAAKPLLQRFGFEQAARASLYLYSEIEDINRFADALEAIQRRIMHAG